MNKKFEESEILELKTSTAELKDAVISIASILNKHQKGELYFGINSRGEVIGQDISDKTLRDVGQVISDHIEPKIFPKIERTEIEGELCITVFFEGHEAPYFAYSRAYIRVGTENKQLSAKELEKFFIRKTQGAWEKQISNKVLSDVNTEIVKQYMRKANEAKRIDFEFIDVRSTLNKLDLLKEDKLIRAGEVLFCDNNSLEVQAAIFAGTDKITFLDIQQFKGNLFDVLKKSENYVKEHMNWRAELTGDGRKEIPEVPLRALTEALVNSLCHKDYTNLKGNEVAIFKDRIEIYNPGQFPEEYTPEDFIRGEEKSILRNPLIANALFLNKDIERWGSGIKRIYEACKEENVKVEFKRLKSGFCVVFYRPAADPKVEIVELKKSDQKSNQKSNQKIINLISRNPKITIEEIMQKLDFSASGVKKIIKQLKQSRKVKRVGPDKGGHWEIINNNGEDNNKKEKNVKKE